MAGRSWSRGSGVVAFSALAVLLVGFVGTTECGNSRYRSVSGRTSTVSIAGYDDQSWYYPICAYQQSRDPNVSAVLGCVWPNYNGMTDGCNVTWYDFSLTVTLLGGDNYWFKDGASPEYAKVYVTRSSSGGGLYTTTGDEGSGPSNGNACSRSRIQTNASVTPIVYYNGAVPADLNCASGSRSYAGCPFTCTLPEGCDPNYGNRQNEFNAPGYRVNVDGQATSATLFDHFGVNSANPAQGNGWTYQLESGTCSWYGNPCSSQYDCWDYYWGETCDSYWTVLRRNDFTYDSLSVRRGENRRNSMVEAYVKMRTSDYYNREIGLVSRFYNADNYFAFMVRQYGGNYARLQGYINGNFQTVGLPTVPSLDLTYWNRMGFKIIDQGSYVQGAFVPNGNCFMAGSMNGQDIVAVSSWYCGNAPNGKYGVFSYYNQSPQFWDLDAAPCDTSGACFRR